MTDVTVHCHNCGRSRDFSGPVGRRSSCDGCGADLRCCRNCTFHDESAWNECREPSAERVLEKAASNYCDYFRPADGGAGSGGDAAGGDSAALSDLEKLFGK